MLLFSSQTSPLDGARRAYVKTRSHFPNVRITNSETLLSSLNLNFSPFKYNGPAQWTQNTHLVPFIRGRKFVRLLLSGTSEIPGIASTWGSLLIIWYLFVSLMAKRINLFIISSNILMEDFLDQIQICAKFSPSYSTGQNLHCQQSHSLTNLYWAFSIT